MKKILVIIASVILLGVIGGSIYFYIQIYSYSTNMNNLDRAMEYGYGNKKNSLDEKDYVSNVIRLSLPEYIDNYSISVDFNKPQNFSGQLYSVIIKLPKTLSLLEHDDSRMNEFRNYYDKYFLSKGYDFVSEGEKIAQSKITRTYKKETNSKLTNVAQVQTVAEGNLECPELERNMYDGCNNVTSEIYNIFMSDPIKN